MNTENMLKLLGTRTPGNFPGVESRYKLQQRAKTIEKNDRLLKSTLASPTNYHRTYPEKLSTAFSGIPVGVTKSVPLLLFVQPDKKFLKVSTRDKETYFLKNFRQINHEKSSLGVKT